jgi:mRNA interferase MazF
VTFTRGEIWFADFGEPVGREQGFPRPGLVVSGKELNQSPFGLVIAVPLTSRARGWSTHVRIDADGSGLKTTSWAMTEQIRSISIKRFDYRIGQVPDRVVDEIVAILEDLL